MLAILHIFHCIFSILHSPFLEISMATQRQFVVECFLRSVWMELIPCSSSQVMTKGLILHHRLFYLDADMSPS